MAASSTPASDSMLQLRVGHLLPSSVQRAQLRMAALRDAFLSPHAQLLQAHHFATQFYVKRLQLNQYVRNVKTVERLAPPASSSPGEVPEDPVALGVEGAHESCLPFQVCCALPSRPSRLLTGAFDGLLTVWNTESGQPVVSHAVYGSPRADHPTGDVPPTQMNPVMSTAVHPTKDLVFTACLFDPYIRGWSLSDENEEGAPSLTPSLEAPLLVQDEVVPPTHRRIKRVRGIDVDPTGAVLASVGDDALLRLWDIRAAASTVLGALQSGDRSMTRLTAVGFHPDGALLSTADVGGRAITWDLRSGQPAFTTPSRSTRDCGGGGGHLQAATCLAWGPCGVRLITGGAEGTAQLWDARQLHRAYQSLDTSNGSSSEGVDTGVVGGGGASSHVLAGHENVVTSVGFQACPTGFFANNEGGVSVLGGVLPLAAVTTSLDGTIQLWNMNSGVCVSRLQADGPVRDHCWLHGGPQDGALITVGHSKCWSLWGCEEKTSLESAQLLSNAVSHVIETAVKEGAARLGVESDEDEDSDEEDEMKALMRT